MSNWKDLGEGGDLTDRVFNEVVDFITLGHNPFPREHVVEDTESGEFRSVIVGDNQTVGDAIANGQWKE